MTGKLLTTKEVAELLGVSYQHVNNLYNDGTLKAVEGIGNVIRFNPEYIESIINNGGVPTTWIELKQQREIESLKDEIKKLKETLYQTSSLINGALGGMVI